MIFKVYTNYFFLHSLFDNFGVDLLCIQNIQKEDNICSIKLVGYYSPPCFWINGTLIPTLREANCQSNLQESFAQKLANSKIYTINHDYSTSIYCAGYITWNSTMQKERGGSTHLRSDQHLTFTHFMLVPRSTMFQSHFNRNGRPMGHKRECRTEGMNKQKRWGVN